MSVSTKPGASVSTLIPCGARAWAIEPAAFYWMSDIAAQLAVLAAAQANGLPTNVGEKLGDRVPDRNIAQLTVVANESYRDFADSLQKEYAESGVSIGMVRQAESLTEEWLQDSIIG